METKKKHYVKSRGNKVVGWNRCMIKKFVKFNRLKRMIGSLFSTQ